MQPIAASMLFVTLVGFGAFAGCTDDDSPDDEAPQLERIDQPAEVDEERLGGNPGAVNEPEPGG